MGERSRTATVALPRQRTGTRPAVVGVALDRRAGAGGPLPPAVATAASLAAAWRSAARADQVPAGIPGLSGRRRTAAGRSPGRVAKRFGATLGPGGVGLVTAAVDAVVARHFAAAPAAHAGLFLALALVGLLLPLAAGYRFARAARHGRGGAGQAAACAAFAYAGALLAFGVLGLVLLNDLGARLSPPPH
ncbi:hypothetical protein [Streptacidiphilus monticola]|uniref:DUF4190 domain-containing protein n=1 Tax=Streptacidiphilus monticola TaxID=2161674 RepID=A0ABW1G723_9ACTN